MTILLANLLGTNQLDSIRTTLLAKLQGRGLPTTDWGATGIERTIVEMVAQALQDLVVTARPIVVGGGFIDYATGDWLTFNSKQRYNNDRNPATYTQGTIVLTNTTSSLIPVSATALWFKFPSGNRYNGPIGAGPFSIPANGTLSITVQSESPNHSVATGPNDIAPLVNYVDPSAATPIIMVTPLAGVTATNPAPLFSSVTQAGIGSGVVTPTGAAPAPGHNISIRVDVSGQVGGALVYSYSLDGAAWVTGLTASSQANIGGFGIGFTLANGAGNPSFQQGTVYGFSTPGSWITQQGTDQELDIALKSRDVNRWPSLAAAAAIPGSPTLGLYDLLVRLAPSVIGQTLVQAPSQVTQTLVQTDGIVNNKVNIYVAGQGGILPGSVIAAIQAFLAALNMITDNPVVLSPAALVIQIAGLTITVKQASLAAAQVALQSALQTYFAGLGINASATNGVIRHARIVQIIEDIAGVVDLTDTTMTLQAGAGAAVVGSITLPSVVGQVQLPQWSQQIATAATWSAV